MNDPRVHVQFDSFEAQTHAARLGMWLFLASEVLLFSGLFTLYASYRAHDPNGFAEAVRHSRIWLGTAMTFVLLTSSLTVALAVHATRHGRGRAAGGWLLASLALGVGFLCIKGTEYAAHVREGALPGVHYHSATLPDPTANVFFTLYWLMTGLHALHVIGGLIALAVCGVLLRRGRIGARHPTPVELTGMYWHLVDILWLFLWPMLYLMR